MIYYLQFITYKSYANFEIDFHPSESDVHIPKSTNYI